MFYVIIIKYRFSDISIVLLISAYKLFVFSFCMFNYQIFGFYCFS